MKRKEEELRREKQRKLELVEKLKAFESKLLIGDDIIDHTNEQERRIEERRLIETIYYTVLSKKKN
jgi:hypothetical protein